MNLDSGPRRGVVSWYQEVGDPWTIKGRVDRSPRPRSDLAADADAGSEAGPVAHYCVITALDHLGSVVDAMVRDEPMRHYAPFTSLRTALLASARARWMLAPDESRERQYVAYKSNS
ncbi:hypothetical protein H7J87_29170 [Mycolicibacterium wolinskyi]|uniref:hypothetical protein n=1 Tax=Mycolicibacterium TaxID=1866885 RepID=UPI001055F81E|nr:MULTISPECIES: hypothetical protein [Mycolicibacterium]MCV7289406.1 hypothetical protein [Mycolicibacterium wolinskyi]MCV7297399.1 hypothetical protein [Mycolicibacterium goodii]